MSRWLLAVWMSEAWRGRRESSSKRRGACARPTVTAGGGSKRTGTKRAVARDNQLLCPPRTQVCGTVLAQPARAHTVHVEVDGLEPARTWWYRFRAAGVLSPVGRTRTLPAPGASLGRLALAVVSCQHYEHGYYTPYQHLAQEDLDLGSTWVTTCMRPPRPTATPAGTAGRPRPTTGCATPCIAPTPICRRPVRPCRSC